jgi:superfamily II DNA/RNA helicase
MLETALILPDLWQQKAIRALQQGQDVVVAAPTGSGKTYIFELLIENGFSGKAVYTVPTRALANDKRLEWSRKGWRVGITTGDRSENTSAPVIVATLETQKARLLQGEGPDLLVIDEYQMLGDPQRGLNYELAIASAPPHTQLLLLSGSVGNPEDVTQWLQRLGRKARLVRHEKRPVPLEEVSIEALRERIPMSVRGFWPRAVAKVLKAGMAPLLAFAPRRKAAEDLAHEIARMLPEEDPLVLTPEQERLAGDGLKRLLRARIAYHHSGLDYAQRASLVEPLAKAGQLRVVVATMGLAAGINFSMRSVLVTDRQYRSREGLKEVRPDELLQMFGRAGRRGMDKVGYIAVAHGKPRLQEARPLRLRRSHQVDWPSVLRVMQGAIEDNRSPQEAARKLMRRLFSLQRIPLGLTGFRAVPQKRKPVTRRVITQSVQEFENPDGNWERKRSTRQSSLKNAWMLSEGHWKPALQVAATLQGIREGNLCKLAQPPEVEYGRMVPVARFGNTDKEGELVLNRWLLRALQEESGKTGRKGRPLRRNGWKLDTVEKRILPKLPLFTHGGRFHSWHERHGTLYARLHYRAAVVMAQLDSSGRALINPRERSVEHETDLSLGEEKTEGGAASIRQTVAQTWHELGLIDSHGAPTRRGILFSFFNYGEGLAIAAALEDARYPIEDVLLDLANLRAGHRFDILEGSSGRMAAACRSVFGLTSIPGYLSRGLPPTYGEGASEILFQTPAKRHVHDGEIELRGGDIERARLEWQSLIRHVSHCPALNWDRWLDLQQAAMKRVGQFPQPPSLESLPSLTGRQQQRHKSFLVFDGVGENAL